MPKIQSENKFVDKSSVHGMFQFDKDGVLKIGGVPAFMMPMASVAIQHKLMTNYLDNKKYADLVYYTAKTQGIVAVKLLRDKFGIKSMKDIFSTALDQGSMTGLGKDEIVRFSEKEKQVILRKISTPFEDAYVKMFGYQKDPISHFFRGVLAGVLSELFGEDIVVIETQSKVMQNNASVYEGFPRTAIESKELKDSSKNQIPLEEGEYPELENLKKVLGYLK